MSPSKLEIWITLATPSRSPSLLVRVLTDWPESVSVWVYLYGSVGLSVCLSVTLSVCPWLCMSVTLCLCFCLVRFSGSVSVSVRLSVRHVPVHVCLSGEHVPEAA